jgi:hypothetical protein
MTFSAAPLLAQSTTPAAVVDKLLSLFDAQLPAEKRAVLIDNVKKQTGGSVNRADANAVCSATCKLIFGSPEFQFC